MNDATDVPAEPEFEVVLHPKVIAHDDCQRIYQRNGWPCEAKPFGKIKCERVGDAMVYVQLVETDDGRRGVKVTTYKPDGKLEAVIRFAAAYTFDALDAIVRMRDRLVSEQTNTDDKENRR